MSRRAPTLDPAAVVAALAEPAEPDDSVERALLDATADLLATFGVRRWSVDDVAERSGMGRTTIYRRFDGRDDLVHAVLTRDARRFFFAVADAVAPVEDLADKVAEGMLVGLRAARLSVLGRLVEIEPALGWSLLSDPAVLASARETLAGALRLRRRNAVLVAELLIRLGCSLLLAPGSVIPLDDDAAALPLLRSLIAPLLLTE